MLTNVANTTIYHTWQSCVEQRICKFVAWLPKIIYIFLVEELNRIFKLSNKWNKKCLKCSNLQTFLLQSFHKVENYSQNCNSYFNLRQFLRNTYRDCVQSMQILYHTIAGMWSYIVWPHTILCRCDTTHL